VEPVHRYEWILFSAATRLELRHLPHGEALQRGRHARFADQTALKTTARRMIVMMQTINKQNFGGASVVTCYTMSSRR